MDSDLAFYEKIFDVAGLKTPTKRFLCTTSLVGIGLYLAKPEGLFDKEGNARPWYFLDVNAKNSVYVPWWAYPLAVGIVTSVLI